MWHAELVGVVRAYPATQELYDIRVASCRANIEKQRAAGRWFRTGVANGQGRQRAKAGRADTRAASTKRAAEVRAQRIARIKSHAVAMEAAPAELKKMMDENFIKAETIADAELGNIALKFVTAVVMDSEQTMKDRIAAVKILAEFTKQKPQTKQEVAFKNAEDFLAAISDK